MLSSELENADAQGDLQKRNAVVSKVLNLLVPVRGGKVAGAPRVVVEGKEVTADLVRAAVHVMGSLHAVLVNIGSGIADGDLAEVLSLHVSLGVTSNGLDVGGSEVLSSLADNLVSREEGEGVVVLCKLGDGGKDVLQVSSVVGQNEVFRLAAVEGVFAGVDVKDQINTSFSQFRHALGMVLRVVDSVDTDGVDAEVNESLDITLAHFRVGERVDACGVTARLVVYTTNVEALSIGPECCRAS